MKRNEGSLQKGLAAPQCDAFRFTGSADLQIFGTLFSFSPLYQVPIHNVGVSDSLLRCQSFRNSFLIRQCVVRKRMQSNVQPVPGAFLSAA